MSVRSRLRTWNLASRRRFSGIGREIRLGIPLGLGKPNHIVNEFFRRAPEDPRLELRIFTALTLGRPRWGSDLERRFIEPLAEQALQYLKRIGARKRLPLTSLRHLRAPARR